MMNPSTSKDPRSQRSFTCTQHPKKPQTDIETGGRCGRKGGCDTLKTATNRLASPKSTAEMERAGPTAKVGGRHWKKGVRPCARN